MTDKKNDNDSGGRDGGSEYRHYEAAGLGTIARGEIISQADFQLEKAIANCLDPNTDAKAPRTVTIKITLKPDAKRQQAEVSYTVDLKTPSDATGTDQILFRQSDARGFVPKGEQLGFDMEAESITRIGDAEKTKVTR
jgi:hypothetical protein